MYRNKRFLHILSALGSCSLRSQLPKILPLKPCITPGRDSWKTRVTAQGMARMLVPLSIPSSKTVSKTRCVSSSRSKWNPRMSVKKAAWEVHLLNSYDHNQMDLLLRHGGYFPEYSCLYHLPIRIDSPRVDVWHEGLAAAGNARVSCQWAWVFLWLASNSSFLLMCTPRGNKQLLK